MQLNDDDLKNLWQQETVQDKRTDCLSSEFLVRAGEGNLSTEERTRLSSHLAQCSDCAEEYRIARSTKEWATQAAARHVEVFPARPVTNSPQISPKEESWWQRMLLVPLLCPPVLAAGAALSVLLLIAIGWLGWQALQKKDVEREIVVTTPTPLVTPSASPLATSNVTPAPATLVAQLNDGLSLLTLDQNGNLSGAENLPPAYQQMLKEALTTQQIERSPLLAEVRQPTGTLRGSNESGDIFTLTAPTGKVILTDRPNFRWTPLKGATRYVVEIYDEQFNLVLASLQLAKTSWTAAQPLKRDQRYFWQVKANKEGQEVKAPPAAFRVLSQAKASELTQARRAYASSHLTLGLLYAQAGLLEEAETEFRALQKANPNSEVASRLLRNVQRLKR
jgi:hypothetical protein